MHTNIEILLLILSLFSFSIAIYASESKNPNSLLLACGSENGGKDSDGRAWESDKKYLVKGEKSVETKAEIQDPSLSAVVPYMTGRIFTSETTYQLPVQNATSRTLLRLYFYPSSYPNFNISNSYFSVVAGEVTLVNNFSAFLTAEALSQAYFIKEYFLAPLEFSTLNVTFKPFDKQPQAFAFVNGIEVISAPELFSEEPVVVGTGEVTENLGWDAATTTVSLDATSVDLFAWQNSVASPTMRDYAIRVSNKSRDAELWLTLRPNVKESPLYVDVLLNGLEIFKLSKSNLAGPNPIISDMMRKYQEKQAAAPKAFAQKSTTTTMALITGAAGGAAAFGVAAVIFLVAHKKKKRVPGDATSWLPISWNSSTTSGAKSSVSGKSQGSKTISSDAANSGGSDSGMDHQNAEQIDQNILIAMHRNTLNLGSDDDANDSSDDSTDDVFSQIANPKGL
ncbi:unnamed protein product [Fraxinus pennsylvanica]|uniref:Malectin-like domain-containing protein n=1 Tax=Fraxinus pennsylvanica TaxID=56036 RepID=A0AAD1ZZ15_9LAMI|nr:unnamed protein product [Fraxinus pennsylvanica]